MHTQHAPDTLSLLDRASRGNMEAWGALLTLNQKRLQAVVAFRLDRRVSGRVDVSDVVQEVLIAATHRRSEFFAQSGQSLFLWLRWMATNKLLELHRHHLGVRMRDVRREAAAPVGIDTSSAAQTRGALAAQLTAGITGPATAAGRAETRARLEEALHELDETDREVLAMRHYEQLTNGEAAQVLGIQERAAAKRYVRALERLRQILARMPGGLTGLLP
jgi:RNA polymerase sigma-70 factor (ECF subfamily)